MLQIRGTAVLPRQPDREDVRGKRGRRRESKGLIAMPLHCRNPVRLSPLPACKHRWRSSTSILPCSTHRDLYWISFLLTFISRDFFFLETDSKDCWRICRYVLSLVFLILFLVLIHNLRVNREFFEFLFLQIKD